MLSIKDALPTERVSRRPKTKFYIHTRPFAITPFMIAPVLPAETLEQIHFQAREVSMPVKNPIIGWKSEFYWFYVKIRDLNERDTLDDLFTNSTASVSALNSAADASTYHAGNAPNYTSMALRRVVETYFRDDGEVWNANKIGSYPAAQFTDQMWLDSVADTTLLPDGGAMGIAAGTTPEALDKMLDAYEYLRSMSLTTLSFEDYLATFGVRIANAELHRPELVGRKSVWQYPVNTVDPTTGTPTSALSFSYDENIRERKFFKEPGFIIGVHVVRPKLYFKNLKGSLTHYLDQGLSWLPAIMRDQPETSLREFAKATGPISGPPTNDYWLDMRDLFMYGDQFSNIALNTIEHSFGGPTAALVRKYAADADVDALFVNAANNYLRADGVCQLSVKGSLQDLTGAHVAERSL